MDDTDWSILDELQRDGRLTMAELARRVHLGASATTERVRRMESTGIIRGYRAVVDFGAVGVSVLAVVRLKYVGSNHRPFKAYLEVNRHIFECTRITGEDCYILVLGAGSMAQLEQYVDDLARFGDTHTSVVYSQPLLARGPGRPVARDDGSAPAAG